MFGLAVLVWSSRVLFGLAGSCLVWWGLVWSSGSCLVWWGLVWSGGVLFGVADLVWSGGVLFTHHSSPCRLMITAGEVEDPEYTSYPYVPPVKQPKFEVSKGNSQAEPVSPDAVRGVCTPNSFLYWFRQPLYLLL